MIKFTTEKLFDVYDEAKPLLLSHYEEISTHARAGVPLMPIESLYKAIEDAGKLLVVVGRDEGNIICYFSASIAPALHYASCLTCVTDIFYIKPEYRKGWLCVKMFKFVEQELRARGVNRWETRTKVSHDVGPFLNYLGFSQTEVTHEKWL